MVDTQKRALALVCFLGFLLVMALGAPPASAQGFNFTNFGSTTGLYLNGSAAQFGSGTSAVLRLTPQVQQNAGSFWYGTPQAVSQGFTTTFQFRITPGTPTADGLAFVIQNSAAGTAALGPTGAGIGYGSNPDTPGTGIADSLAVEFDTFQNTGDPNANHIGIQSCGTGPNSSDHDATYGDNDTPCNLGLASQLPITLADGNIHTVVINYDGLGCGEGGGELTIYVDGNTPILQSACGAIGVLSNLLSLGDGGTAYVGFTGATGADVEDNDILNWSFTPHNGTTTNAILTFTPGNNVSAVGTFSCPSNTSPCTDPEAHSLKLTASQVTQPFSLIVSATTVFGDGFCPTGGSDDPTSPNFDYDCRFVDHFGVPTTGGTTVPLCDDYNNGACVYYRIENPPNTSNYQGPIYWYIAWNDTSGVARCNSDSPTYQCNNEQMADDPSSGHADVNQFTQYITTFFTNNPNQVGTDPGIGGKTSNFNDVGAVFPLAVTQAKFIGVLPFPDLKVPQSDPLPIIFALLQGNKIVSDGTQAPNAIGVAVLNANGVRQPIAAPGSSPPAFNFLLGFYYLGLDTSQLTPGSYTLVINSNLFSQQTIPFTVVAKR